MGWQLELVRSGAEASLERIVGCEVGDIAVPETVDEVSLPHKSALRQGLPFRARWRLLKSGPTMGSRAQVGQTLHQSEGTSGG